MKLIDRNNHVLKLSLSDDREVAIDFQLFLKSIIKDPESPYWKILEPEIFGKGYIHYDELTWDQILETRTCSGETFQSSVVFSERELTNYLSTLDDSPVF